MDLNTRLTKERREQIIESVFNATLLPKKKKDLIKRTTEKVRSLVNSKLPKEFEPAIKNLPKEWFAKNYQVSIHKDVNPISLLEDEEKFKKMWSYNQVNYDHFYCPVSFNPSIESWIKVHNKPDNKESWEEYLAKEIAEAKKLRAKEDKVRQTTSEFLWSVNTYKQVIEKMPEFERHLPNYVKHYPIAVNTGPLTNLLDGLGFDQGVK